MDFESERKKKIVTLIEAVAVLGFVGFVGYQIYLYADAKAESDRIQKEVVAEQLEHSETVSGDVENSQKAVSYVYEGEHPYASVELPYGLASLIIETDKGSAAFANGKSAGINIDVKEIMDGDTVTAVDLSSLGCEYLSISGTGGEPVITLRFSDGYTSRVALKHAIQAGYNENGDIKVYNLQKGDDVEVAYIFNIDSYKYPGVEKFVFTAKAAEDGALSVSTRGTILSLSGLKFDSGMISVADPLAGGRGVPADGTTGFFTYDFKTGATATTTPKESY